jgi:hypothetical protein
LKVICSNSTSGAPAATRCPADTCTFAIRVADGALNAAYLPGRDTMLPMAETVCVNGSTLAFAVLAATTGFAESGVAASPLRLHAVATSASAQPPRVRRRTLL